MIESDDIEVKINIIYNTIAKYEFWLTKPRGKEHLDLNDIKQKLEKEKQNLKDMMNKYPEYFI